MSKRKLFASGLNSLTTSYISSENNTSTPTTNFVGTYVYCVQYTSVRLTCASDVNGTIFTEFSDDGVSVRETVTDTVVGGTPYFRIIPTQNQYARIRFTAAVIGTSLNIYTVLAKQLSSAVSLTAGTNITITGSYPNFTISAISPMASTSYLVVNQNSASTTVTGNAILNLASTTVLNTADWANDGAGKYTYNGALPAKFVFEIDFTMTPLFSTTWNFYLLKNGLLPDSGTQKNLGTFQTFGPATLLRGNYVTPSFVMSNGDFLQIYLQGITSNAVAVTNKIIIANTV